MLKGEQFISGACGTGTVSRTGKDLKIYMKYLNYLKDERED